MAQRLLSSRRMSNSRAKRLGLHKQTIRTLTDDRLVEAAGGATTIGLPKLTGFCTGFPSVCKPCRPTQGPSCGESLSG